jgi:putative NADH-flavin reductase
VENIIINFLLLYLGRTMIRMSVASASGFIVRVLCADLVARGVSVCGISRSSENSRHTVEHIVVKNIDVNTDWRDVLADCDCVIHA